MAHVTYVADAFYRAAQEVRQQYPEIDKFIANGKKDFHNTFASITEVQEVRSLPLSCMLWNLTLAAD